MNTNAAQWADLVTLAEQQADKARKGDTNAAREVLVACAIALRGVIELAELPDPERMVSLRYLLEALEQIADGTDARKALGTYAGSRRKLANRVGRNLNLFWAVGTELERLKAVAADSATVRDARVNVARRYKLGTQGAETVRKAWEGMGGMKAWRRIRDEWEES